MSRAESNIVTERSSSAFSPRFDPPPSNGRDDLALYLRALRAHMRLVLALPIVLGATAVGLNMLQPREYVARSAFLSTEPSSSSGAVGSLSSVATQLGIPALSAIASGSATLGPQFYGDLLSSSALVHELVVTRFDASNPGEYGGKAFTGTLVEYFAGDGNTPSDREIDAMNRFMKRSLAVTVDRPTGVVRFQVRTRNRILSAQIARRMLDLVNDFNLRRRQTQAGNERDFAAKRTAAAADTLHAAERALAEFRASNIDFSRSPRLAERENELQRRISMSQQMYTTIAQKYELANLEAIRNTPVITVLDVPEGVVEAMPRNTRIVGAVAAMLGLIIASLIALRRERQALPG